MGSYYYVKDKGSELGFTPVPEGKYTEALLRITEKYGVKITDEIILREIDSSGLNAGVFSLGINEMEKELT